MIIFLYGKDEYRKNKKAKNIIDEYKKKRSSITLEFFDFSEKDTIVSFVDFISNNSLFEKAKFSILRNIFSIKEKQEEIISLLQALKESENNIVMILEEGFGDSSFSFLLDAPVKSQNFEEITNEKASLFLKQESKERGLFLSQEAENFLLKNYGSNTWGIATELEKLNLLNKKEVGIDILKMSLEIKEEDIFTLIFQLKNNNLGTKLSALENFFLQKGESAKLFNLLAYQQGMDIKKFARYDLLIKSGKLDYEEALLDFSIN